MFPFSPPCFLIWYQAVSSTVTYATLFPLPVPKIWNISYSFFSSILSFNGIFYTFSFLDLILHLSLSLPVFIFPKIFIYGYFCLRFGTRLEQTPPKEDRRGPREGRRLRASYEPDRYHLSTFWNETRGDAETRSTRPQDRRGPKRRSNT